MTWIKDSSDTATAYAYTLTVKEALTVQNGLAVTNGNVTVDDNVVVTNGNLTISKGTVAINTMTMSANSSLAGSINHTGTGYGFVHNTGLWEDVVIAPTAVNRTGPTGGAAIDDNTGFLKFDSDAVEEVCGVIQMPHGWKSGTNVEFHVHAMSDSTIDPSTNNFGTNTDGNCTDHTGPTYLLIGTGVGTAGVAGRYVTITAGTNANVNAHLVSTVVNADAVNLTSDPTNGGNSTDLTWFVYKDLVKWRVGYKVLGAASGAWDQATYTNVDTVMRLVPHTSGNATMQIHDCITVNMEGFQDSCLFCFRLSRMGTNADVDTYEGDAWVGSMDAHYLRNTLGSLAEYGENY